MGLKCAAAAYVSQPVPAVRLSALTVTVTGGVMICSHRPSIVASVSSYAPMAITAIPVSVKKCVPLDRTCATMNALNFRSTTATVESVEKNVLPGMCVLAGYAAQAAEQDLYNAGKAV